MRLIDADALIRKATLEALIRGGIKEYIRRAPTISGLPAAEGYWENVNLGALSDAFYKRCSVCQGITSEWDDDEHQYCPTCGTRMKMRSRYKTQIVVTTCGENYVGETVECDKRAITLDHAKTVQSWSNGRGIEGLANLAFRDEYTLTDCGRVCVPASAQVAVIDCDWQI